MGLFTVGVLGFLISMMFHEQAMSAKHFGDHPPLHWDAKKHTCKNGYRLTGSICVKQDAE